MILVLGGTKDGRELAGFLAASTYNVMLTVTTPLAEALAPKDVKVNVAKLTKQSFADLLKTENIEAVVDATHPFAEQISSLAFLQTSSLQVPYLRFERTEIAYPSEVLFVEDFKEAALLIPEGKVFAAIGVRHLQEFLNYGEFAPRDVFVRVLSSSLEECVSLGIPKENIFTGLGPFTYQENSQHFSQTKAKWLITKASGSLGGEKEKISAALALGLKVIVVKRPFKQGRKYYTHQEILDELRRTI